MAKYSVEFESLIRVSVELDTDNTTGSDEFEDEAHRALDAIPSMLVVSSQTMQPMPQVSIIDEDWELIHIDRLSS